VLVHTYNDTLGLTHEIRCDTCGNHYRIKYGDKQKCPFCVNGAPAGETAAHARSMIRGSREEQQAREKRVYEVYKAMYRQTKEQTTGIIARDWKLKVACVQAIVRRARGRE